MKIVHVVGTGTLGEPLIGLLADHKDSLGIDQVTFHKRTPLLDERAKVKSLMDRGAKLCVDEGSWDNFKKLGHPPSFTKEESLKRATVVIDCTPAGLSNKNMYSSSLCSDVKGFIAQGSETGFGTPYAYGINDNARNLSWEKFIQVVSCNTHNIASLIDTMSFRPQKGNALVSGNFVCMRRANDISQDGDFIASPEVSAHNDSRFGTHHAKDVHSLFATRGYDINVFSSAMKVNSQYMHSIWFRLELDYDPDANLLDERIRENQFIAITYKKSANKIFSFGRDHGYYGRILNHSVLAMQSLEVNGNQVFGFAFTPQDGNSLLSSIAAAMRFLYPADYTDRLSTFSPYLFQEV